MKKTSTKIVFFGTEDFSLTALAALIEADYTIAAVITKPDSKKGRGQHLTPPAVKILAEKHNIPVWQPKKLTDITGDIQALSPAIGVLVSYGKIIPQSIIDLFTPGIINVHPSLLPRYRGPSPIESAIKNGDIETGVTIMQLAAKMDAGPIYATKSYPLSGTETRPNLYQSLAQFGANLLLEVLPGIINHSIRPTEQDDTKATYCHLLQKTDSWIDLQKIAAAEAERTIRAHLDFPKTKIKLLENDCIITKAHISDTKKTPLDLPCQDGVYLCIDELITPNGRRANAQSFINGHKNND